jgi:hypothetical protein
MTMNNIDRINEALDRTIAMNEAYRLGCTSGVTTPEDCVEMRMLLDAIAPEERILARRHFGLVLVVSA